MGIQLHSEHGLLATFVSIIWQNWVHVNIYLSLFPFHSLSPHPLSLPLPLSIPHAHIRFTAFSTRSQAKFSSFPEGINRDGGKIKRVGTARFSRWIDQTAHARKILTTPPDCQKACPYARNNCACAYRVGYSQESSACRAGPQSRELHKQSWIVISLCEGIRFAAISTSVLIQLNPTCLSFGTAIAVLAVPVPPPLIILMLCTPD